MWAAVAAGEESLLKGVQVTSLDGAAVPLEKYVGKPVVLFYEDKDASAQSKAVKDELIKRAREKNLLNSAHILAVANLAAYDWFPARNFARDGVKEAERKAGIPLFTDWKGVLSQKPLELPKDLGSVLIFSADQRSILFRKSGKFSGEDSEKFFKLLEALVQPSSPPAASPSPPSVPE